MRAFLFAAVFSLVCATEASATSCVESKAAGLFEGTATIPNNTFDVTLNVYCENGNISAQIFTSMGDFSVKQVSVDGDRLIVRFDSGSALGQVSLIRHDLNLAGGLKLADEIGSVSLTRRGNALSKDAMEPRLDLTPAQWRADLKYFAKELPRRHANAFFFLPRANFDREVAELDGRIQGADGDEMYVGLQRIAKSIGDGHTGLVAPADRRLMPLQVERFGDDFRVVAVGPGLEKALGSRIEKIDEMPIAEVWSRVMTLTPRAELEPLRRSLALAYLTRGYALHGLKITSDSNRAIYTLLDDRGQEFALVVRAIASNQIVKMRNISDQSALRFRDMGKAFYCTAQAEDRAVYCAWRGYQDLSTHSKAMFSMINSTKAQKLILDLRDNGGGDYTVGYSEIIEPLLTRTDLNQKGHLYVLIGADTFSAAMNNAAQLQDKTNAVLVGETIGERPNSYQEPRQFRLPNSHLIVRVSTLYYLFRKAGENIVRPNVTIIPTWIDVKTGRDPVLDWVLSRPN